MSNRYTTVAIALHWLIALLLITNLLSGLGRDWLEDVQGLDPMPLHKSFGITILALSLFRLAWRLGHRPPALPAEMSGGMQRLARANHAFFYVIMIVLPLSGWIMSSAGKRPLEWFGFFDIPKFAVERGSMAASFSHETHEILGILTAVLVVLHIGAALYHQFYRRDRVLDNMAPIFAGQKD